MTGKRVKKRLNKLDKYLVLLFFVVILFTTTMIYVFYRFQSVPDTLIMSVFAFAGGECGVMGWIKSTKERHNNDNNDNNDEKEDIKG